MCFLFLHIYRNTPTRVGKTHIEQQLTIYHQKHPHSRGEDERPTSSAEYGKETPPLAWGRLKLMLLMINPFGNTPTRVGKTPTYC